MHVPPQVWEEHLLIFLPLLAFCFSLSLSLFSFSFLSYYVSVHTLSPSVLCTTCSAWHGDSLFIFDSFVYAILVILVLFFSLITYIFSHHSIPLFMLHAYIWEYFPVAPSHTSTPVFPNPPTPPKKKIFPFLLTSQLTIWLKLLTTH